MDNDKIITFETPKGYKFRQRVFDKFVFEKMNDRPTEDRYRQASPSTVMPCTASSSPEKNPSVPAIYGPS